MAASRWCLPTHLPCLLRSSSQLGPRLRDRMEIGALAALWPPTILGSRRHLRLRTIISPWEWTLAANALLFVVIVNRIDLRKARRHCE